MFNFFAEKTKISLETATALLRPDLQAANESCILVGFMCNLPLGSNPCSSMSWFEM